MFFDNKISDDELNRKALIALKNSASMMKDAKENFYNKIQGFFKLKWKCDISRRSELRV